MLSATPVSARITPGRMVTHHAVAITVEPPYMIAPHSAVGGWTPAPRNGNEAITTTCNTASATA